MMVGGTIPSRMARQAKEASTAPAAPRRWPVMDLVELIATLYACLPKTDLMAKVSMASFRGVEVPWALI